MIAWAEVVVGESECWDSSSCGVVVAVVGTEVSLTVVTFRTSTVWLGSSGRAGVSKMAGAAVTVCAGTVVYAEMVAVFAFMMHKTLGSATIDVAVSSGTEGFSSSESGEARSHFTWKCSTRVNHEEVTDGARFSYQSSTIEPDRQCK